MKNLIFLMLIMPLLSTQAEFKHLGEASIVVSGGNNDLQTYNLKTENSKSFTKVTLEYGGHYTLGEVSDLVILRNWDINTKISRKVSKHLSVFFGEKLEGDKFNGYQRRLNSDIGVSDMFYESDIQSLKGELGYRNFYEKNINNGIASKNDHMGRLDLRYIFQGQKNYKFGMYIEYLPNFSNSEDYQINFGPSLTFSLTSIFSFKVGYDAKYDNQPALVGNQNYEYLYTTSLISQF